MREPYYESDGVTLFHGDSMELLKGLESDSIDCVVTDPPYELISGGFNLRTMKSNGDGTDRTNQTNYKKGGFMGMRWDGTGIAFNDCFWSEVMRVLRPGGHLLSFGGTRTSHRMVCAIEDAGFEIRDSIMWVYASGFPKSLDVSKQLDKAAGAERDVSRQNTNPNQCKRGKDFDSSASVQRERRDIPSSDAARQWQGWGTAIKPSHEPICVARKPLSEKNVAANVLKHGTGAINIDACRIGTQDETARKRSLVRNTSAPFGIGEEMGGNGSPLGRFPANIMFSEIAAEELDRQSGVLTSGKPVGLRHAKSLFGADNEYPRTGGGDTGGASRFFFVAKPCQAERNAGCEGLEEHVGKRTHSGGDDTRGFPLPRNRNIHPTVKPVSLMRQLVRLVCPSGGTVLDPFTGSGTTGIAAVCEGFDFIGMDMTEEYIQIAAARIAYAQCNSGLFDVLAEESAQIDAQEAMAL